LSWGILSSAIYWTFLVIGIIFIPTIISVISESLNKPDDIVFKQHFQSTFKFAGKRIGQAAFTFVCLPYEAYYSIKAIAITLWRILITHKKLLEWNPSQNPTRSKHTNLASFFLQMWFAPAMTAAGYLFLALIRPKILFLAGPILISWLISPFIAWTVSQPFVLLKARLSKEQKKFLRKIARNICSSRGQLASS
jgi:hypothetical protein